MRREAGVQTAREFMLLLILLGTTLLSAWPLLTYQHDHQKEYQGRFKMIYIFHQPAYAQDTTLPEKVLAGARASKDLLRWLTTEKHADGVDALGEKPPVGKLTMYLAFAGGLLALWGLRNPAIGIALIAAPLIIMGTVLTTDGQFRRSFGLLPFIALGGGLALGTVWEWADQQAAVIRGAVLALIVAALATVSYSALSYYFRDFQDTSAARYVFFPEMYEASNYMDSLGHPYVYYYSERATLNHETRRVLAPNIAGGEERDREFGHDGNNVRYDLAPDKTPTVPATRQPDGALFLFMGNYANGVTEVEQRYPGGVYREVHSTHGPVGLDYISYYLPADLLDSYSRRESVSYPIVPPKP